MVLEAGSTRAKAVKSVLFKNMLDHSMGVIFWYVFGWGIFTGLDPFASGSKADWVAQDPSNWAYLVNQFAFASTAATIVSGAILGRCRLEPYVLYSGIITGFIYPVSAHWCWNSAGWLAQMGFLDFAGSGVVHVAGGMPALCAAWIVGPRPGRFVLKRSKPSGSEAAHHSLAAFARRHVPGGREARRATAGSEDSENFAVEPKSVTTGSNGHSSSLFRRGLLCLTPRFLTRFVKRVKLDEVIDFKFRSKIVSTQVTFDGHSAPLRALGAMILYCAWINFNTCSAGSITTEAKIHASGRAAVNTILAAGAGSITAMLYPFVMRQKQYELDLLTNGWVVKSTIAAKRD